MEHAVNECVPSRGPQMIMVNWLGSAACLLSPTTHDVVAVTYLSKSDTPTFEAMEALVTVNLPRIM
jgi:hypothetical protein